MYTNAMLKYTCSDPQGGRGGRGGDASVAFENNELARHDLEKGERFGVPVALIVLLLLFGAVVATMLPLGLAVVSIIVALAAVAIIGQYKLHGRLALQRLLDGHS